MASRHHVLGPVALILFAACSGDDAANGGSSSTSSGSSGASSSGDPTSSGGTSSGSSGTDAGQTRVEWEDQFGDSDVPGSAVSAAIDRDGSVIIGGSIRGDIPGETGSGDGFVRKYDAAGKLLWTKRLGRKSASNDPFLSMARARVDADGNVLVLWNKEEIPGPGQPANNYETTLSKWDATGKQLWTKPLVGTFTGEVGRNYGEYIAVDKDKNVVIAGFIDQSESGKPAKVFVRKYDAAGTVKWTVIDTNDVDSGYVRAFALDEGGNAIVALGGSMNTLDRIRKIDANGGPLWTKDMKPSLPKGGDVHALAGGPNGRIAITFAGAGDDGVRRVEEWDASGTFVWGANGDVGLVAFEGPENLVVLKQPIYAESPKPVLHRYDAARNEIAKKPSKTDVRLLDLAVDGKGHVVIAGTTIEFTTYPAPNEVFVAGMNL